jgi:hypothetical protein
MLIFLLSAWKDETTRSSINCLPCVQQQKQSQVGGRELGVCMLPNTTINEFLPVHVVVDKNTFMLYYCAQWNPFRSRHPFSQYWIKCEKIKL